MADNPYAKFTREDMILRDFLAIDRTILANERTFLSYIRTALAQFAAGVSLIKFFDSLLLAFVGWVFIPLGMATFLIGLVRYRRMSRIISTSPTGREEQGEAVSPPDAQ